MHTVLVLGGYGFFGSRICAALAKDTSIRLLIAGRHGAKAQAAARSLGLKSDAAIEINSRYANLAARLKELSVDTVVHTAGPFQKQEYTVARAAIESGCHYVDIADGRRFVNEIVQLDSLAKARAVTVISGASTVPALSSAVIDRYLPKFSKLKSVHMALTSGARTPGIATVKGILGYCGKTFDRFENGRWITTRGWLDLRREKFPKPLGARLLGSCDVPDLELFPKRYPSLQTATFHAGYASMVGHLAVWTLAGLVRIKLLPSAAIFAAPLNRMSKWLEPLISDKGGMSVKLYGKGSDGRHRSIAWHLVASQNHGPNIPCGAAIALVRKLCSDSTFKRGAMPCVGLLTVEEYLAPLQGLDIKVTVDE